MWLWGHALRDVTARILCSGVQNTRLLPGLRGQKYLQGFRGRTEAVHALVDALHGNRRSRPQTESSWNKEEGLAWQPEGSSPESLSSGTADFIV